MDELLEQTAAYQKRMQQQAEDNALVGVRLNVHDTRLDRLESAVEHLKRQTRQLKKDSKQAYSSGPQERRRRIDEQFERGV
jgi:hypothetical protein